MNKTDQQKKGIYINYWTERGLAAKKENQSLKMQFPIGGASNKKTDMRVTTRHPRLKDITFNQAPEVKKMTKEEYKEFRTLELSKKRKNLIKRPYSSYHHKLVAGLYLRSNELKKQALAAAHEEQIKKIIEKQREVKMYQIQRRNTQAKYVIIFRKKNSQGQEYDFMTFYSNNKLKDVKKQIEFLANSHRAIETESFSVYLYDKSEYFEYIKGNRNKPDYLYMIYKHSFQNAA